MHSVVAAVEQAAVDGERSQLLVQLQLAHIVLALTLNTYDHTGVNTRPGSTRADPKQTRLHTSVEYSSGSTQQDHIGVTDRHEQFLHHTTPHCMIVVNE